MPASVSSKVRFDCLDGLRGLAAIIVAVFHFFCAFAPDTIPAYSTQLWRGSDTPIAILYNGGFAVAVFFVLSGFVVSGSAERRRVSVAFNLVQRYVRLAVPVVFATVLAWVLLNAFPDTVSRMKLAVESRWLNHVFDGKLPPLDYAVLHGAVLVFQSGGSKFNNVLWTMQIELIGSWAIYIMYGSLEAAARRTALLALLLIPILFNSPHYSAFAIGALLREDNARLSGLFRYRFIILSTGVIFGAMMSGYGDRIGLHLPRRIALGDSLGLVQVLAAGAILYAVLNISSLQDWLSTTVARFFGRVSFGLYLVHVPLLYTVVATAYLAVPTGGAWFVAALLAGFLALATAVGYLFTVAVDAPVLAVLRATRQRLDRRVGTT